MRTSLAILALCVTLIVAQGCGSTVAGDGCPNCGDGFSSQQDAVNGSDVKGDSNSSSEDVVYNDTIPVLNDPLVNFTTVTCAHFGADKQFSIPKQEMLKNIESDKLVSVGFAKPGVTFLREWIVKIDDEGGTFQACTHGDMEHCGTCTKTE